MELNYDIEVFKIIYRAITVPSLMHYFYQNALETMPTATGVNEIKTFNPRAFESVYFDTMKIYDFGDKLVYKISNLDACYTCISRMPLQSLNMSLPKEKFSTREHLRLHGDIVIDPKMYNDIYSGDISGLLEDIRTDEYTTLAEACLATIPANILCPYDLYMYNINYAQMPFTRTQLCCARVIMQSSLLPSSKSKAMVGLTDSDSEYVKTLVASLKDSKHDLFKGDGYIEAKYKINTVVGGIYEVACTIDYADSSTSTPDTIIGFQFYCEKEDMAHAVAVMAGFQHYSTCKKVKLEDLATTMLTEREEAVSARKSKLAEVSSLMSELTLPSSEPEDEEEDSHDEELDEEEDYSGGVTKEMIEKIHEKPKSFDMGDLAAELSKKSKPLSPKEFVEKMSKTIPEAGDW